MSQHTDHGHQHTTTPGHRHNDPTHAHHHGTTEFDWDVMGPLLEQNAELSRPQYEEAARWIAGLPTAPNVRRVLDIGSGPGVISCLLAEVFPEAEVVAVDGTPALLERTRTRAQRLGLGDRVRTQQAEIPESLDALGEADLIWVGNALHHMGDQRAVLAGFAALLRPGGTIALVEGGLPPRQLPRDIGIGRPGLEARLDAITADWFEDMRTSLPGTKRETEDWSALFTAVGLDPQGTRSFLLDLPAPLSEPARDHVIAEFARRREMFEEVLPAEDVAVLDRLLDPEDPAGLRQRPDVFLLMARTVHLGRRG
ncbi:MULTISPECIES: class I SAM-dependent methyltransferase [unclassified Streptomyces]|uniref:class I SAM-dependent methyltransferase n=1 Tax=unclassified Streptomyces TaxID=2593676 RepID=UPI0022577B3B|nr:MULTISPECIES: methyltransferase domain-containing protein [unclassified Streptomyces]WSP58834.1 class I SAM-dependent methyltransferase [Streptomyces sp. NBC_01241]WSU20652.1 class I SAM-dependent methyltransferase [Streptomyces sp. NBC_01108]MCX4790559.1 class I SAM-dependent methyltransferase [Streptomyces sp. NBC_01221]MCX4793715.1 class I SAM-dependent methyltransferase [Streptomyces sp. NBC_01242]WSJ35136.1 class I SAM-dependent methyltransferase [Streptomyces sp. NBC_01321]